MHHVYHNRTNLVVNDTTMKLGWLPFYNYKNKRFRSTLDYVGPMTFERRGSRHGSETGSPHHGRLMVHGEQGHDPCECRRTKGG